MSAISILYLITLLKNLDTGLAFIFCFTFLYFSIALLVTAINRGAGDEYNKAIETQKIWVINPWKKYSWIMGLILLIEILIPSERTMYLMMGVKYLQNSAIPQKVESIINEKLDNYLQKDKAKNETH